MAKKTKAERRSSPPSKRNGSAKKMEKILYVRLGPEHDKAMARLVMQYMTNGKRYSRQAIVLDLISQAIV